MVQTLLGVSLVLHLTPWPILIYFLWGDARDLSICVLGNNRPLCPPSKPGLIFFLAIPGFYLFFSPFFSATSSGLNRFGSASGFKAWKQDFRAVFSPYLCICSPFPNLSLLHSCVYLYAPSRLFLTQLSRLQKKKKKLWRYVSSLFHWNRGSKYGWRKPLNISQDEEKPCQTINIQSSYTRQFFQGPKMESCVY